MTDLNNLKVWKRSPVVFQGQKRFFIKETLEFLSKAINNDDGDGYTILDVFGGSGLLAHNAKRAFPKARVIFNDYDNVSHRIKNISTAIENWQALNKIKLQYEAAHSVKLIYHQSVKDKAVLDAIVAFLSNTTDEKLSLQHMSAWLCFNAISYFNKEELIEKVKRGIYWCVPLNPPPLADDYLYGLEVVSKDFRELLDEFKDSMNVILILDPPYLWTTSETYKDPNAFGIPEFLELMLVVKPPFIFFETAKSQISALAHKFVTNGLPNSESWQNLSSFTKEISHVRGHKRLETIVYNVSNKR
ncbi:DNA adenine methylase [Psittacicella hinzii]|uniref:Site-specific DNA-methyltransferase (adenine-specific) n=1 Tax=Psittacicella hinzii TaxID=2028575 RepID=A0A3A1YA77_9GAMM|nr:DNA adenine methylase [Psittacicella hinzii]RIY35213.1 hypothetical protein CKF58_06900 [Psittacicella hinzii]